MLNIKDKGIILQIIYRCERIIKKINNISEEQFNNNCDVQELICFNLFQIGELSKNLSEEFIKQYNKVPWKLIINMRNRIVHGYDSIDLKIIWETSNNNIKELVEYCDYIIKNK